MVYTLRMVGGGGGGEEEGRWWKEKRIIPRVSCCMLLHGIVSGVGRAHWALISTTSVVSPGKAGTVASSRWIFPLLTARCEHAQKDEILHPETACPSAVNVHTLSALDSLK